MGIREEIQRKYNRKMQENEGLQRQLEAVQVTIRENNAYLQALQDAMRLLDREPSAPSQGEESALRAGSAVARAYEILKRIGKPMHVNELLKEMAKPVTRNSKAALSGTLSPYVKRCQIFTRPAPNTFGLIEFRQGLSPGDEPPEGFGSDRTEARADGKVTTTAADPGALKGARRLVPA